MYKHIRTRLHPLFLAATLLTLFTFILIGCGNSQSGSNPPKARSVTPTATSETPAPTPTSTQVPPSKAAVPFTLMRMLNQQHGWALTTSSILKTADGGRVWQDVTPSNITSIYTPAVFYDPLTAWVNITKPMGENGQSVKLLHTTNGGQTWTTQTAQINTNALQIIDLKFINAHEGWTEVDEGSGAGQQGAGIVHTTDGGATWKLVSSSTSPSSGAGYFPVSGRKTGLAFANSSTGWATVTTYASNQSFVYVTHDGGISWTQQTLPPPNTTTGVIGGTTPSVISGQDIVMPALENNGFAFYLSHDGGTTWQSNPVVFPGSQTTSVGQNNIYVTDPTHAWALDSQGVLYITTNGGQSWSTPLTLQDVRQFSFISNTTGWAYGGLSLLKTTDGGRSWNKINHGIS